MDDARSIDARAHLESLVAQEIRTLTGKPNRILGFRGSDVIVATSRSPQGQPVPIAWVQDAIDMLLERGELVIDVDTVRYRSAFIGAVLTRLPGTTTALAPRRVILRRTLAVKKGS